MKKLAQTDKSSLSHDSLKFSACAQDQSATIFTANLYYLYYLPLFPYDLWALAQGRICDSPQRNKVWQIIHYLEE